MRKNRSKEYLDGTRRHGAPRLPINKFLMSRVGLPWAKVHSELSAEFDRRSYVGYRFWKNLDVAENVWIGAETGTVYQDGCYGGTLAVNGFYVHPWTGILCHQKRDHYSRYGLSREKKSKEITRYILDATRALEKIEGIWYSTEYTKDSFGYYSSYPRPSTDWNVTKKRQLTHKELKLNNLVNTPEDWEKQICDVCLWMNDNRRYVKCFRDEEDKMWVCYRCMRDWYRRGEAEQRRKNPDKYKNLHNVGG